MTSLEAAMERFLKDGIQLPDRDARKDTLWRRLHEIEKEVDVIRKVLLRNVAMGLVNHAHPLARAGENLFTQLERIDPDWRRRLLGQAAPGVVHEAFDWLNNELNALVKGPPHDSHPA